MLKKGENVRHTDKQTDEKYGLMKILEVKNNFATCSYGDFYNYSIITFPLTELKQENT